MVLSNDHSIHSHHNDEPHLLISHKPIQVERPTENKVHWLIHRRFPLGGNITLRCLHIRPASVMDSRSIAMDHDHHL
jgi:hypothetical protein